MAERFDAGPVDIPTALSRCSFCHDQCMSATPEAVFTGDQQHVVSRVAIRIRRLIAGELTWSADTAAALFGGMSSGLQREYCIYQDGSQRIEPYLSDARRQAVDRGVAPEAVRAYGAAVDATGSELGAPFVPGDSGPDSTDPSAPILVGGDGARTLDPEGWSSALLLLGEPAVPVITGSSGYFEYRAGLWDLARRAGERAVQAVAGVGGHGPIVTTDPAFAFAARYIWPELGLSMPRHVHTLSEYLRETAPRDEDCRSDGPSPGAVAQHVTYHDPGLLARGLDVTAQPRDLLRWAGATLLEPVTSGRRARDDGGYPGYPFPHLAQRIAESRADELEATGAEAIVTASPWSVANLRTATELPVVDIATYLVVAQGRTKREEAF